MYFCAAEMLVLITNGKFALPFFFSVIFIIFDFILFDLIGLDWKPTAEIAIYPKIDWNVFLNGSSSSLFCPGFPLWSAFFSEKIAFKRTAEGLKWLPPKSSGDKGYYLKWKKRVLVIVYDYLQCVVSLSCCENISSIFFVTFGFQLKIILSVTN